MPSLISRLMQAFVSYLRSVYLQKDKSIFKIDELPIERYAESLGLPGAPKIKFLSKEAVKRRKNASRAVEAAEADVRKEKEDLKAMKKRSDVESEGREAKVVDNSDEDSEQDRGSSSGSDEEIPAGATAEMSVVPGKVQKKVGSDIFEAKVTH
jgi:ATP-dependent RNA helicase DDX10/DBP4